jgi:PKD repeat protein
LKRGSSGADVKRLQQFLAADPSVYPEGTVSGYFGALTEKAVQRWQAKNNIISNGTPSTTGYGQIGPKTAAAIALLCSAGATGANSASPVGGYIQVSPISGNAPLNVNVLATVNSTNSCAGAVYQLNWGDGSNGISIPVSSGNCQPLSQTYQHTYSAGGTYQITLSAGSHQTGATVTVYGNSSAGTTGTNPSSNPPPPPPAPKLPAETFSASPVSGPAPLTVTFSGTVTSGDKGWCSGGCSDILILGDNAQAAVPLPAGAASAQTFNLQHTYNNPGQYTATLYQGQSGSGRPTVGSPIIITVGANGTAGPVVTPFNPPSVTPGLGGNPNAVGISFEYSPTTCNYQINWGDNNADNSPGGCNGTDLVTKNITHTYGSAGAYTITLKRDNQVSTAGVTIQ